MKAIDILHKQLLHTIVLLIEQVKHTMSESADSAATKQARQMHLFENLTYVLHWVQKFNPEGVTYDHL